MSAVDLHLHSTASDGACSPSEVVQRAILAGLSAIALTDHDTIGGLPEAVAAAAGDALRVVSGCEFSAAAGWGEVHLLGYFLPLSDANLLAFLARQQEKRLARGASMVDRLNRLGVDMSLGEIIAEADGGVIGRPHVARVLVKTGVVKDVQMAFRRYLGLGRPAYIPRDLPLLSEVAALVRDVGGVTSAAHLKRMALDSAVLDQLVEAGVDAVEVIHPSHDGRAFGAMERAARRVGLSVTGGSDWHGGPDTTESRTGPGYLDVPIEWLDEIELRHRERSTVEPAVPGRR
ncbi:MAG: PHP domain-containing protein [Gemmatimonadales bacterium]